MSEEMNEYLKSRREAKNTVFVDLFHFPKYRYELFRALHPEMTDVSEEDVIEITLGERVNKYEVTGIAEHVLKGDAASLYKQL